MLEPVCGGSENKLLDVVDALIVSEGKEEGFFTSLYLLRDIVEPVVVELSLL
uniref:Uncharacterized protein n=1 Tax=Arion vulgaris TaxID=1028688 RepID=A0A0B6YVW4_9EUPU